MEVTKEMNSKLFNCSYMPWVSLGAFRADYFDDCRGRPLRVLALGMIFPANDDRC